MAIPFEVRGYLQNSTWAVGDFPLPTCAAAAWRMVCSGAVLGINVGCKIGFFKGDGVILWKKVIPVFLTKSRPRPKKFGRLFGGKGRITPKKFSGGWGKGTGCCEVKIGCGNVRKGRSWGGGQFPPLMRAAAARGTALSGVREPLLKCSAGGVDKTGCG